MVQELHIPFGWKKTHTLMHQNSNQPAALVRIWNSVWPPFYPTIAMNMHEHPYPMHHVLTMAHIFWDRDILGLLGYQIQISNVHVLIIYPSGESNLGTLQWGNKTRIEQSKFLTYAPHCFRYRLGSPVSIDHQSTCVMLYGCGSKWKT